MKYLPYSSSYRRGVFQATSRPNYIPYTIVNSTYNPNRFLILLYYKENLLATYFVVVDSSNLSLIYQLSIIRFKDFIRKVTFYLGLSNYSDRTNPVAS